MTRTWIVYNKPKEPSYTHAGMLMGLGLTGAGIQSTVDVKAQLLCMEHVLAAGRQTIYLGPYFGALQTQNLVWMAVLGREED